MFKRLWKAFKRGAKKLGKKMVGFGKEEVKGQIDKL